MSFDAGRITASLDLDRSPFTRSLAAARKSAADFARQTYEASLGVRGSAGAIGELQAVNAEADRVDGRDVELDVDKDGSASSHLQSLSGGFKSLAGNIRATGTVLSASAIPFLIAGIGAATPSILALGASLAGLALNLGKAAVGFGLVGAAAGGGALVGLKAYSSLISKTLTDSRDLWAKSNEEAVKALEKQRTEILLNARGFNAWNSELNESILRFTRLEAAVGSRVFPTFTRELDAWNEIITQFSPQIANTSGRIAQIATGFTRWFRTADDGRVLSEVVDFLSESAVRAARGLSQLGQIGISAFRPLIPLATDLQGSVLGILSATNRWVQSAEGQRKLGQIYRSLWEDAKRLAPVVMDLWRGTVQLFNALDRAGIADQASRGFANLASAYERATRAGGGLDRFLRGALRLMPFVGRATEDVVGAIFGIARAVIGAREQGSRLTILQKIFRGIGNAAKPLQSLVVGTFRDLGPVIAQLLPALSRFFATFAGSSGPLVAFARTITSVLQAFNRLPAPIRNAAAQLLALKIILGGLGLGAVIAPLGRLASNMVLVSGAASKLAGKSALLGVAGGLASIGAVIAGGIGLGVLFYGLKRAYDKNEQFRESVNRLKDAASKAFKRISAQVSEVLLPAVRTAADKAANALLDIFDIPTGPAKKSGKRAGDATASAYQQAVSSRVKDGRWDEELGKFLGKNIAKGLKNFLKSMDALRVVSSGKNKANVRQAAVPIVDAFTGAFHKEFGKKFNLGKWITDDLRKIHVNKPSGVIGETIRRGILRQLPFGMLLERLSDVLRKTQNWANGEGKTKSTATGRAFNRGILLGLPGGIILTRVQDMWEKVKRWANNNEPGKPVGKSLAVSMLEGLLGFNLSGPLSKKLNTAAKNAATKSRPEFIKAGLNAALGFLKGFKNGGIGGGLVNVVKDAIDAVRHFGKEGSPWGLTKEMGRNAGLGFVKGFRDSLGGVVDAMRRIFDSARQLGPGDPGYLDDGFRKNSRQSPGRGKYGYVQAEDGSWVYNPELYREEQRRKLSHRYPHISIAGRSAMGAGRMTDEWRRTLNYLRSHPNNYDIGGDVDIRDTPRKIIQFLKRDGWFRRGGSLYHPDTPKRYLPGGRMSGSSAGGPVPRLPGPFGKYIKDGIVKISGPLAQQAIAAARKFYEGSGIKFVRGKGELRVSATNALIPKGHTGIALPNGDIHVRPKFMGTKYFDNLLAHEVGHQLGLAHQGGGLNVMSGKVLRANSRATQDEINWLRRNAGSPHHRPVSEDGMKRVMREHRQESRAGGGDVTVEQAAMRFIQALEQVLPGFIDRSMGGYFHHRTAAGADPR